MYTRNGAEKVLEAIDDGNKATGGLTKVLTAWGIIGLLLSINPLTGQASSDLLPDIICLSSQNGPQ